MIEWLIGFLVARWYMEKQEKKERQGCAESRVCRGLSFGYLRNGESSDDLT